MHRPLPWYCPMDCTPICPIQHCRERLTGYKVPKHIALQDQLPKSPVGKILRAQLRSQ